MRLARPVRPKPEPTIALINIVFLMLVFFLVAGQIAQPVDRAVTLVNADLPGASVPDDVLVLRVDGSLHWRGAPATVADFVAGQAADASALRIMPDRAAAAPDLVALAADLRRATGRDIVLVTQQGLAP